MKEITRGMLSICCTSLFLLTLGVTNIITYTLLSAFLHIATYWFDDKLTFRNDKIILPVSFTVMLTVVVLIIISAVNNVLLNNLIYYKCIYFLFAAIFICNAIPNKSFKKMPS